MNKKYFLLLLMVVMSINTSKSQNLLSLSRFQYLSSERSTNTDNYNAALTNQFGGNDDINGVMWILK